MTLDGRTLTSSPEKMIERLKKNVDQIEVLIGSNANEGTKPLMYFLPYLFPNEELRQGNYFGLALSKFHCLKNVRISRVPALDKHEFSSTVDRIFSGSPIQVRDQ